MLSNCYMKFKYFLILVFSLSYSIPLLAQISEDSIIVRVDPLNKENKIVIHYDLNAPKDKEYIVTLYLKRAGDETFSYKPRVITGDVGKGYYAGKDRKIVWDITREFALGLAEKDYYFYIEAELVKSEIAKVEKEPEAVESGSNLLYWIGGGVAVVGGVVAAILISGSKGSSSVQEKFPDPPSFPQ